MIETVVTKTATYLKQQFVDGDLDDDEFEAQLEDRLTEVEG